VTSRRPKVVLLGMMSKMPVAGVVWQTVHYLVGLERLGFETYYVEAHARTPSMFMRHEADDGSRKAAAFIDGVCRRFGLHDRWAFHALHEDGRCYGLGEERLRKLYRSAELLINLHGGTEPLPEHAATGRLVYVETDPVQLQVELHERRREALDFLEPHVGFFSFGENLGQPDCLLPSWEGFEFKPTRQPVVLDFWRTFARGSGDLFTTVGNWRQEWRDVLVAGERYSWSKHHEFLKFLELPQWAGEVFELALAGCGEEDRRLLEQRGWRVRDATALSDDVDEYRAYVCSSRGEFTVAKDQNVRLRTGWFSDRSATYLAAGRPVITQETGFSNTLPAGEGLFGFSMRDDILAAVDAINSEYERHSYAAREIATEYFSAERVLAAMLEQVGLSSSPPKPTTDGRLPSSLDLQPVSRRPLVLPDETVRSVLRRAVPQPASESRLASIVVVTLDNLVFTRLCLESVLANTAASRYELIVVDNGSGGATRDYLRTFSRHDHVHVILNDENVGFASATNQGLAMASGDVLVLLNNDTIVPPGWLGGLTRHLQDVSIGAVGPVTNRIGNEAQIETPYRTYGELIHFAPERAREFRGRSFDVRMLAMFCLALRRDVYERVGGLDERYEIGLLEDDDYSMRIHAANLRVVCAEDVFVHHFGEASFGKLVPSGEYNRVLDANRRRFEEKWGVAWQPYERRPNAAYDGLVARIRAVVDTTIPSDATVLVVSRGDERLLELGGRRARHFPQAKKGVYAGHHPGDSGEAIMRLEELRARSFDYLVLPRTGFWWLDHYDGLRRHLEKEARLVVDDYSCKVFAIGGNDVPAVV
jgi:GT2 family glycosyltransferase